MIRWDVLNIGSLSRNRFWGEDDSHAYRTGVCTSTLVRSNGCTILVDPSLPPEKMPELLRSRSGLKPDDVDIVFLTHSHKDHYLGVEAFKNAKWMMAPDELLFAKTNVQKDDRIFERVLPAAGEIMEGIRIVNLPGHTAGLAGLTIKSYEGRVLIASDAVMTRDFFAANCGYFNSGNFEQAQQTIKMIREMADIIVPGHDNYFPVNFGSKES